MLREARLIAFGARLVSTYLTRSVGPGIRGLSRTSATLLCASTCRLPLTRPGDEAYFSRLDNVVEGEVPLLQTFAEHIRRQVPQSLIQTILGEHIVDDFTYRYPRSLFLFLYSLDLEGMVGNAVDATFVNNMHMLRECAYDAEQQLFVNYGPRERAALLFFEALLAWEVGGRREKIKFML